MHKLKTGVIGVGSLGQHHARVYSELDNVELAGIYDVNTERAAEIAAAYNTSCFENLSELAQSVDAVSVVVPTDLHFDVACRLMQHNVHMLVEKPITSTTAEAEQLVAMAQQKKLILQVGHIERFNPVMTYLENVLQLPRFIEATRLAPYPPARVGARPRGTEVSVVLDLMIHDLDIILHLVHSPVADIHAVGVPVLSATEDIANVRLRFENGCIANVTASRISMEKMRKIRIFQEDTYVSLDYMNQSGKLCRKTATGIEASEVPIDRGEPLAAELLSFTECVRHQRDPVVSGEHGSNALKLAVEICRHMQESPS